MKKGNKVLLNGHYPLPVWLQAVTRFLPLVTAAMPLTKSAARR